MLWTPGQPVQVVAVDIAATTASVGLYGRGCWLRGFLLTEVSGSAGASVVLVNGSPSLGAQRLPVKLTSGATSSQNFGDPGIPYDNGISLNVLSGNVEGVVWVAMLNPLF